MRKLTGAAATHRIDELSKKETRARWYERSR